MHAAAADPDPDVAARDRADQGLRAGAGEHRSAVVLGNPVSVVAELVGEAREISVLASASAPVEPSEMGDWSRTETFALMVPRSWSAGVATASRSSGPCLRTVAATRYVTPLREGGSLPGLMEAEDDGLYVTKFRGAGQGCSALVAEVIVGELAGASGCSSPSSSGDRGRSGARRRRAGSRDPGADRRERGLEPRCRLSAGRARRTCPARRVEPGPGARRGDRMARRPHYERGSHPAQSEHAALAWALVADRSRRSRVSAASAGSTRRSTRSRPFG